jgi:hypothetical protein
LKTPIIIGGSIATVNCNAVPISPGDKIATSAVAGICEGLTGATGGITIGLALTTKGSGAGTVEALVNLE